MKCTLISLHLAAMPFLTLTAQYGDDSPPGGWQQFIYFEGGMIYPKGEIKESVSIRQNISYYYVNQYSSCYVSSETSGMLFGVRYGYYFPRFRSGISTGVRFTGLDTEISGYTSNISDFLFYRFTDGGHLTFILIRFRQIHKMEQPVSLHHLFRGCLFDPG